MKKNRFFRRRAFGAFTNESKRGELAPDGLKNQQKKAFLGLTVSSESGKMTHNEPKNRPYRSL
jgi:hypothetical protein